MSDLTSLKVPLRVRDRLVAAANVRGVTVRALLDELSQQAMDEALMEQAAQQMRHLRDADPTSWAEYVDEGRTWEEGTIDRLDA